MRRRTALAAVLQPDGRCERVVILDVDQRIRTGGEIHEIIVRDVKVHCVAGGGIFRAIFAFDLDDILNEAGTAVTDHFHIAALCRLPEVDRYPLSGNDAARQYQKYPKD